MIPQQSVPDACHTKDLTPYRTPKRLLISFKKPHNDRAGASISFADHSALPFLILETGVWIYQFIEGAFRAVKKRYDGPAARADEFVVVAGLTDLDVAAGAGDENGLIPTEGAFLFFLYHDDFPFLVFFVNVTNQ